MTNTAVTCSIVAREALPILENMLSFTQGVNRDWEDEFASNVSRGYMPGQTILIKKPPRYTYRAGRVAVPQATTETSVPLVVSQGGCDLNFTSLEQTLSFNKLEDKVAAAMAPVANEIDRQGLQLAHFSTFNTLNAAGALPTTQALAVGAMTDVNRRLDEMGAPVKDGKRRFIMNPALNGAMVQGYAGLFNNARSVSDQYDSGYMAKSFGLVPGMDQNVDVHTNGTQVVTGTAVAAGLSGASIACVGLGGTITRGTIVQFPGVFAVNPQSRQSTGVLAQFVITADLAAAAVALPISPAMVTSGAFQNVSNATTAANFTIVGAASTAYGTNIAFHKDAFTLAMVPMWAPPGGKGVIDVAQKTRNGFTVKVTQFYDGVNDNAIWRLDVLFGWVATYPELSAKFYTV
jgi:hypothetical protein